MAGRGVVGNMLEFAGHKRYRRDYTKVYEVPPLSDCVQRRAGSQCRDGRCCPPPASPPGPTSSSSDDQTRSPLRPRHSDACHGHDHDHGHEEQADATRSGCEAGQGCCHNDDEEKGCGRPGTAEQAAEGEAVQEEDSSEEGITLQVAQDEAGREGTMV